MVSVLNLTHLLSDKQVWVVADIHGRIGLFRKLLEKIGYTKETHAIISVGDLVDRGEDSPAVVEWFMENGYVVRGNHEELWLHAWAWTRCLPYEPNVDGFPTVWVNSIFNDGFFRNGMGETLRQYIESGLSAERWLRYFAKLPFAIEVGEHLIVHAGVDPTKPFDEQAEMDLTWTRFCLKEQMRHKGDFDFSIEVPPKSRLGKRIICGHTETFNFSTGGIPILLPDRIHLDVGTASNLGLAAFCINTGEIEMVDAELKLERLYAIKDELRRRRNVAAN